MAIQLERFISGLLTELPPDHPDRKFLRSTLVQTQLHILGIETSPQEILTEEFAQKVNVVAANIPDDVEIDRLKFGKDFIIDHEIPQWQASWRSLSQSLKPRERKELTGIVYRCKRSGIKTIGDLRNIPFHELFTMPSINQKRAAFITVAFRRELP